MLGWEEDGTISKYDKITKYQTMQHFFLRLIEEQREMLPCLVILTYLVKLPYLVVLIPGLSITGIICVVLYFCCYYHIGHVVYNFVTVTRHSSCIGCENTILCFMLLLLIFISFFFTEQKLL